MKRTTKPKKELIMPAQWNDKRGDQFYGLALLGATEKEMCIILNLPIQTFEYWKRTKPAFLKRLNEGKTIADTRAVKTLLKRALGYNYVEEHDETRVDEQGKIITVHKTINKHIVPNITALIFWLKNRQRALWSDTYKTEQTITFKKAAADLGDFTTEELLLLKSIGMKGTKSLTNNVGSN